MADTRGVVFIAAGAFYANAAVAAARSVREANPTLGIHLFTDSTPGDTRCFDGVSRIEGGHYRSKVDHLCDSPFERTLYLDTDVRVVAEIGEMFDLLDRFDIALAHAHARNRPETNEIWHQRIPASFPQLNAGVILFKRTPEVLGLLQDWKRAFHEAGFKKDQVTLRELIWSSDLRLAVLPPEYNLRYAKYLGVWAEKEARPRILHWRAFHEGGPGKKPAGGKQQGRRRGGDGHREGLVASLRGLWSRRRAAARWRPRPAFQGKIFGIGFHKTGTSSLAKALRILGYRTIHGDPRKSGHAGDEGRTLIERIEAGDLDLPVLERYQAFTDNPYFSVWRPLAERYPRARFILTVRDEEAWIESCVRYYAGRRVRPMRTWRFGEHADPSSSPAARQAWLEAYRAHNAAVRAYFGGDCERLLILDVAQGDGWEKLCPFLGAALPAKAFPRENEGKVRRG
jgi:hypothetical protein